MKLIFCTKCKDVVNLSRNKRKCLCGESSGKYITDEKAVISGPCVPLGISNSSLLYAMMLRDDSYALDFSAFVFHTTHPNIEVVDEFA